MDGGTAAAQLTGKRPAQTPELAVTAGGDWRVGERLTLSAEARYESARFEDDLNSRRLKPGASLDARAAWRVGEGAEIYLAAENLTNARIVTGQTGDGVDSLAAPQTFRLGFSLRR
ncbi:hypothetical protein [Phenylobacterium aquaticum]|uniref:hypothetical protein n=1 Tax=Phenylobacterium aquaticum TaxID=1763816 RepID=UPI0030143DE4